MKLRKMAFVITDRCTAACRVCCFGCCPENSKLLDKEIIKDYIDQLAENNPDAKVAFTGGEALMYREMLLECMTHAKKRGLKSTLVSNCSFGSTSEKAKTTLQKLHDAGLISLSISADVYHQEFVPAQNVKNVLAEAMNMGIDIQVRLMEMSDDDGVAKTLATLRPEIYGVHWMSYPIFPVGSALEQPAEKFIRPLAVDDVRCPMERSLTAMFDGELLYCCSQFSREMPFIKVGSFGKTTLEEAITNISHNDFIYVMLLNGLHWYVKLARQLDFPIAEKYGAPCHFCHEILGNKDFIRQATPYVEEETNRLRLQKLFSA